MPEIDAVATTPLEQVATPVGHIRPHWPLVLALVVVAAGMMALATRRTSKSS